MRVNYRFVPAAFEYKSHGGLGCYVRYRKRHTHDIRLSYWSPGAVHLQCPDRDLLLVRDTHDMDAAVVTGQWDEFYDFNVLNPHVAGEQQVEWLMLNYHAHSQLKRDPDARRNGRGPDQHWLMADSGGFQLVSGAADFIDPVNLAGWYSRNVDTGMVLDLPVGFDASAETKERSARLQRLNTDLIKSRLAPGCELINVIHGNNVEERLAHLEKTHDPEIKRAAVGGIYFANSVAASYEMLVLVLKLAEMGYRHVHFLGLYNLGAIASIVRLSRLLQDKGIDLLLTSDSSTHIMAGKNKEYLTQLGQSHGQKRSHIGDKSRLPATTSYLNCQCPVCRAIKYEDVFNVLDNATIRFTLSTHNLFEQTRYVNQLVDVVSTASISEFKQLVSRHLQGNNNHKWTMAALDLLDYAERHGAAKAYNKYGYYMQRGFVTHSALKPLLAEDWQEEPNYVHDRIERVLDAYEKYHQGLSVQLKAGAVHRINSGSGNRQKVGKDAARRKTRPKRGDTDKGKPGPEVATKEKTSGAAGAEGT